jgi:hypothetical protein
MSEDSAAYGIGPLDNSAALTAASAPVCNMPGDAYVPGPSHLVAYSAYFGSVVCSHTLPYSVVGMRHTARPA